MVIWGLRTVTGEMVKGLDKKNRRKKSMETCKESSHRGNGEDGSRIQGVKWKIRRVRIHESGFLLPKFVKLLIRFGQRSFK